MEGSQVSFVPTLHLYIQVLLKLELWPECLLKFVCGMKSLPMNQEG